jgi:hypothetical protein
MRGGIRRSFRWIDHDDAFEIISVVPSISRKKRIVVASRLGRYQKVRKDPLGGTPICEIVRIGRAGEESRLEGTRFELETEVFAKLGEFAVAG